MPDISVPKGDRSILEKEVRVKVDRPIGSSHPKHKDMIYPVNYGFAEGFTAAGGKPQDVYILGVSEPLEEITVTVIAVIERADDNGDKWVGVPKGLVGTPVCYECSIEHEIAFQEKFFQHTCNAVYEKTCGCVMYTEKDGCRRYLLIENDSGHIGFPKGHVEYGETEEQTAVREVMEETKLSASPEKDFRAAYSYRNSAGHEKTAVYFVSHYDYLHEELQKEEISRSWLLPYDEAIKLLNYPQDIPVLEAAEKFIEENS